MTAEALDKFAQLITVALGLVAALVWNTAIQNLFTKIFGKALPALIGSSSTPSSSRSWLSSRR